MNVVYRPIKKEWLNIPFENEEDRSFFAQLLSKGDEKKLQEQFFDYFDFRSPEIKRKEFNSLRKKLLPILLKRDKGICQLGLIGCEGYQNLVVDHFVPLSSNKLNRKIRGLKTHNGKKPVSQSFGSNNIKNLMIACDHCNSLKKHRFLNPTTRELI